MKLNFKESKKQAKGITLIALVITIIVLLILAGVTIITLTGENGVITKAQTAKKETEISNEKEQIELAVLTSRMNNQNNAKIDKTILEEELIKLYGQGVIEKVTYNDGNEKAFPWIVTGKTKTEYKIDEKGNVTEEEKSAKITYELDGGKFEETVKKEYKRGEVVTFLSPVKEGHAFDGWYTTSDKSGTSITSTEGLTGDITLYAKWIEESDPGYFTYSISDGKATITGKTGSWNTAYANDENDVINLVIPKEYNGKPVVAINEAIFSGCDKIKKLVIQNNISLGNGTFRNCNALTDLIIPISVNVDNDPGGYGGGYPPFDNCKSLTKVKFTVGTGNGVNYSRPKNTPWYLSSDAGNSITIEMEDGIKTIGNNMFSGCSKLQEIKLPSSVTSIGSSAFQWCSEMTCNFNDMTNLSSIGKSAFYGCSSMTGTIKIPENVQSIPETTFTNVGMEKLIIPDTFPTNGLSNGSFSNCNALTDLIIPISVNLDNDPGGYSGHYPPFDNCKSLTRVEFTAGTGNGVNYSRPQNTPWALSEQSNITMIFNPGIISIGQNQILNPAKYSKYFRGTQEQWEAISKSGNSSEWNILEFNYKN